MQQCPICNQYKFDYRPHSCPPKYMAWDEEVGDSDNAFGEGRTIYADSAQDAAAEYCRVMDEGENPVRRGVYVLPENEDTALYFDCEPEIPVQYIIS